MTFLVEDMAREILDRPTALLASVTMLRLDDDGLDAFRVVLVDTVPCKSGKRKGKPNWRTSTNRQVRVITSAEFTAWCEAWSLRTGLCIDCTGSGERFASWSITDGTKMRPCLTCSSTGKAKASVS